MSGECAIELNRHIVTEFTVVKFYFKRTRDSTLTVVTCYCSRYDITVSQLFSLLLTFIILVY